ncbi:MAG TPA: Calx-beta domain-containing protein [Pyrinomonadaceae bacterium]|nr:Calx-beta domain-containing protein [Pyrinomonadaceae bacterium]
MKNIPRTSCLRRRLALLLLVSTINFIAAPFLLARRSSAAPLNAPDGPTDFIRQINLRTNDIVYSPSAGKIYASVPSSAGSSGNSLQAIDPTTGLVTSSTFVGSEPGKLTISDDGHSLYVSLDGSFSIRRFDTLTNTPGLQFSLGTDPIFTRYSVGDFAVAPANPSVLAVARIFRTVSPPEAGVAVFDDGVRRTKTGPSHTVGADFLAFSANASKLYGTGQFSGLQTMAIDASGVTVTSTTSLASGTRIKFSGGKIFSSAGHVIDPEAGTLLGTFFGANSQAFVPDTAAGRAYYLTPGPGLSFTLKAFDTNTFVQLGALIIDGVSGTPTSLVRWGPNGLAFRTDNDQLFIIQTSLIPSAEPIPTPTPTPSPTPSPSPSPSAATFARVIPLTTNDLVYNQTTQRLYASVPSSEGSSGNSLAEIDPVMGSITSQVFVGSEPTHLALADDNQTLYVGLNGAASLRTYNIISHTPGAQFPVGRDDFTGPYSFSDIAVSPGNPLVVAVARQQRGVSPSEAGVAIFDNGVRRTKTGPEHISGSDFLAFASSTILYGNSSDGLTKMTIANDGVTVNGTARFSPGNSMIFANGLLYGGSGQIINPTTDEIVGTFSNVGSSSSHVIDVANNRAFFAIPQGPNVQIRAYDLNTFLPVGFATVSGFISTPLSLVRWGINGLAFRTGNRQVVLVETALVNDSVPISAPTPIPTPTPVPSPPYIPTFIRRLDLPANNLVFSEATQALYASVPSSAGANGNSITKITPATAAIGPSTFVGSEPNKMAISDDGQTIWVHLDGANAARRFEVAAQTPGLQFNTGTNSPADMEILPGSPQSVAITQGGSTGVAIYDNGVKRPNTGNFFPSVGPIEFASPSVVYGYNFFSTGFDLVKYLVDANGVIQQPNPIRSLLVGFSGGMEFSNGLLYSGTRVVDPEAGTMVGTFQPVSFPSGLAVDAANHRVFVAISTNGTIVLQAFDSNTFLSIGSITIPGVSNSPLSLVRWGVNGLAFTTQNQFNSTPGQVYLIQTELVSNAAQIPTGVQFEFDKSAVFEQSSSIPVKVSRTGDVSGTVSVDFATSDGTAIAGSDYTATSGTLTFAPGELSKNINIPIVLDNLFENADETFGLTLSNATGGAIITGSASTITIIDDDLRPAISVANTAINVFEGDSGDHNLIVTVRLTNPSVQTVTVDYATANGTAAAGSDYVAASGSVTIPAGSVGAVVNIPITGDTTIEPDETFSLTLSNATNVNFIFNSPATVTIVNDDSTLQFNNAAVSVNESAGFVDVTVTRVGDTLRPVSVQYSTTDTAGLQNCQLANGKASERCDYGTAAGRLQFGTGEITKTFTIPIVNDALVEGDETLTVNLSGASLATLGAPNAATITIVDNDTTPATQNPIDGVTPFITQQYIDFLGRLPDTIGLANWTNTLGNCPNGGFGEFDNPTCDRVHVSAGFFLSEEFRGRGYFAYKFYEVGFDRRPAYAEFVPDMAQVGGPQSPESEVISKAAYTDAFVQRSEFKNRYDALSNSAYVDALEINAEVTLANKAALVAALNGNQKTRAQVLREIVELQSVTDKFFIRAFVAMQYFGYLRRDPDTLGYDNWVATLTADPSNFRHMIFGFIYSDEYRHRFGP